MHQFQWCRSIVPIFQLGILRLRARAGLGFEPRILSSTGTAPASEQRRHCQSCSDLIANLFSSTVHAGLRGSGAEHPAHAHLWLDACLRGEPLQVLPAAHLHAHAAGALRRDPGQRPAPPALPQPQTRQDPQGLGEGQRCKVHGAHQPGTGGEDQPRVRGHMGALAQKGDLLCMCAGVCGCSSSPLDGVGAWVIYTQTGVVGLPGTAAGACSDVCTNTQLHDDHSVCTALVSHPERNLRLCLPSKLAL